MTIQLVDLFFTDVFKHYSVKYNIFRDLFEHDLLGLEIRGINYRLSRRIKKIILNNKEICYSTNKDTYENCDILALGSYIIFKELSKEIIAIGNEDLGFKISQTIKNITEYNNRDIQIDGRSFPLNDAYSFGILNVTPDSFSDGGKYFLEESAVERGIQILEQGTHILDVGGESSRPGSERISEAEELKRVIPVIQKILITKPDSLISIDTTRSLVAREALEAGAKIVNDISAFEFDNQMLDVVKKYNAVYVLMHMLGQPKSMQENPVYEDVVTQVYDRLVQKVEHAKKVGIKNIIIDPGIGFGKRVHDNYELIKRLNEFKGIGHPILIGLSRKSFLGKALNLGIDEREDATLIAETIAIKNGARFIRTHNAQKTKMAFELIKYFNNPELLAYD